MIKQSAAALLILTFAGCIHANVVAPRACGERVLVEDAVVIDLSSHANCNWLEFQTQQDRILAFTLVDGTFEQIKEFLTIHDGFQLDSPVLVLENQKVHEKSKKDLPPTIYTTGFEASLRFKKMPTSTLKLKIQKAVDCPFNLGAGSQCGRILDSESCYCAIFTLRPRWDQIGACSNAGLLLVSLETQEEQDAIHAAWGYDGIYWTSLNDIAGENYWVWETIGNRPLYPGYANWGVGQPDDNNKDGEDCVSIAYYAWNDAHCGWEHGAICEAHP